MSRDDLRNDDEVALDVIIRTTMGSGRNRKVVLGQEFDKDSVLEVLKAAVTRGMRGPTEKKTKKK